MSSASYQPRCPFRVESSVYAKFLLFCAAGSFVLSTTTASLNAQVLHDYRLVDPASHMQPWPDDKAEILIAPPASLRIAAKWRTNLTGSRKKEKPQEESQPKPEPQAIPAVPVTEPQSPTTEPAPAELTVEDIIQIDPPAIEIAPAEDAAPPMAVDAEIPDAEIPTVSEAENTPTFEVDTEVIGAPPESIAIAPIAEPSDEQTPSSPDCYQAPPVSQITSSIALPSGKLPTNVAALCAAESPLAGDPRLCGGWSCTEHHWAATCMHHRPLYFEAINAERYGYTMSYALQPVISAAHFFATIPALPYKMAVDCPRDCVYTLGHYRPGSCVPRRANTPQASLLGGAVETGTIAGLILLIP